MSKVKWVKGRTIVLREDEDGRLVRQFARWPKFLGRNSEKRRIVFEALAGSMDMEWFSPISIAEKCNTDYQHRSVFMDTNTAAAMLASLLSSAYDGLVERKYEVKTFTRNGEEHKRQGSPLFRISLDSYAQRLEHF